MTSWKTREEGFNDHDFNCIFGSLASGPSAFFGCNTSRIHMCRTVTGLDFISLL